MASMAMHAASVTPSGDTARGGFLLAEDDICSHVWNVHGMEVSYSLVCSHVRPEYGAAALLHD